MTQGAQDTQLTQVETRDIITPYAFKVADDLLGTALATPMRRGIAILLDLLIIVLLTGVDSMILAALFCWMFWRASNKLHARQPEKKRSNLALRIASVLMLFIFAIGLIEVLKPESEFASDDQEISAEQGLVVVALTAKHLGNIGSLQREIASGACQPALDCWTPAGQSLVDDLAKASLPKQSAKELIKEFVRATSDSLDKTQRDALKEDLIARYQTLEVVQPESPPKTENLPPVVTPQPDKEKNTDSDFSLITLAKTLAEDLGLGFGWAAFYFSVFTAWWQGQTPAKRLLGIKVIKLDGSSLNLWESFGRYGGYGAGVATGLLGFLQIYWDANRQAIQDKISETLVIDLKKPKVALSGQQVATLEQQAEQAKLPAQPQPITKG